jgi:hypothetical protein
MERGVVSTHGGSSLHKYYIGPGGRNGMKVGSYGRGSFFSGQKPDKKEKECI